MPKYKVTIEEAAFYVIVVEADSEDEAAEAAEEAFVQSQNTDEFFSHVEDREAISIVEQEDDDGVPKSE